MIFSPIRFIFFTMVVLSFLHSKNIRIMSYNIHHGRGTDDKVDLGRIAKLINDWSPDLVALQEVDNVTSRSNFMNQTDTLASKTRMFSIFGKNLLLTSEKNLLDFLFGSFGGNSCLCGLTSIISRITCPSLLIYLI